MFTPNYPSSGSKLGLGLAKNLRGFTLIELVMVMVLVGVLAVFIAPRFNRTDFEARGFHDETLAFLRYAQKTAIAQRRTVCVTFTSTSLTLAIASSASTYDCSTAGTLTGPNGNSGSSITLAASTGVNYLSVPASFNFDGLGQPITSAGAAQGRQTFQVNGLSNTIAVESSTGYVHE